LYDYDCGYGYVSSVNANLLGYYSFPFINTQTEYLSRVPRHRVRRVLQYLLYIFSEIYFVLVLVLVLLVLVLVLVL
jgi:hypothetical protein